MKDPSLLLKTYIEENIIVKLKDLQTINGKLHGFDEHLNIILSEVESYPENFLFIRGENILYIGQE